MRQTIVGNHHHRRPEAEFERKAAHLHAAWKCLLALVGRIMAAAVIGRPAGPAARVRSLLPPGVSCVTVIDNRAMPQERLSVAQAVRAYTP
jgi:hypothetical protein